MDYRCNPTFVFGFGETVSSNLWQGPGGPLLAVKFIQTEWQNFVTGNNSYVIKLTFSFDRWATRNLKSFSDWYTVVELETRCFFHYTQLTLLYKFYFPLNTEKG